MFGSSVVIVRSHDMTIAIPRNDRTTKFYFDFVRAKNSDFLQSVTGIKRRMQLRKLPLAHSATTQKPSSMRLITTSDEITAKSMNEALPTKGVTFTSWQAPDKIALWTSRRGLCCAPSHTIGALPLPITVRRVACVRQAGRPRGAATSSTKGEKIEHA